MVRLEDSFSLLEEVLTSMYVTLHKFSFFNFFKVYKFITDDVFIDLRKVMDRR